MDEALISLLGKKDFEYITVKEICETAGVNRSTFYLHYETVADLLNECVEYSNDKLMRKYADHHISFKHSLSTEPLENLVFFTPEFLTPYFEFIRENKTLFQAFLLRPAALSAEKTFQKMFRSVFSPILDRFHYSELEKNYAIPFYIAGVMAVVSEWLKRDCTDPIEQIIHICMRCVLPDGKDTHLSRWTEASKGGTDE